MKMWKLMAATLGCLVPFAMADKVMLKDGSVLVGSIGKIHEGKVMLKTSFAGAAASTLSAPRLEPDEITPFSSR